MSDEKAEMICIYSGTDKVIVKDIVSGEVLHEFELNDSMKLLLNIFKSRDIVGVDGKVFEEVNPFRKD